MSRFFAHYFLPFIVIATILVGCENDIKEVQNFNKKVTQIEEGKNINTIYTTAGKIKANLKAPLMLRYMTDSPYFEFPQGIHVDMYRDSTIIESVVIARYCKYLESQSKVYLRDSVRVNNIAGDTLWCLDMWWDQQKKIFYSDKKVRLFQKLANQRITGTGFVATQDLNKWVINTPLGTMDFPKEMR